MHRILVVDDVPTYRELTCDILRNEGFEVEAAATAADAIRMSFQRIPDLILLDVGLPDKNGLDLLEMLRMQPQFVQTPVIIITADDNEGYIRRATRLHASGYLLKGSFMPAKLLRLVHQILDPCDFSTALFPANPETTGDTSGA